RRAYPGTKRDSGDGSDSTGPLYFGDSVTLESRYMPGSYLCIQSNKLSLLTPCAVTSSMADDALVSPKLFILHSPTLRELVQINAQAAASPPPSSTFISPSGQILDGV